MRYGRYGTSHLLMRLGIGITLAWIAFDMWRNPANWIGYLPQHLPFGLTREGALQFTLLFDGALAIAFLLNKFPRWVALFTAIHLAGILIVYGIDAVTIRDVGLFGLALALLFWPQHGYRKRWWKRILPRRHPDIVEE